MSDEELVVALAPLSLRSMLDAPSVAEHDGQPVTDSSAVVDLFEHYESGLFDSPFAAPVAGNAPRGRRLEVAASVAFQAVVAQVANPVLLAHRVVGIDLWPDLDDVRWRKVGWGTRFGLAPLRRGEAVGLLEVVSSLADRVVEPWLAVVLSIRSVPEHTLRGNARAALWTAVRAVDAHVPVTTEEWAALEAIDLTARRETCCLIHYAGLVACEECPRAPG